MTLLKQSCHNHCVDLGTGLGIVGKDVPSFQILSVGCQAEESKYLVSWISRFEVVGPMPTKINGSDTGSTKESC